MANKYVKQEKYGLLLLVEFVYVLSWSVTSTNHSVTSAIADARHQEVLPSANSISKYRVTRSYLCCVRETFV